MTGLSAAADGFHLAPRTRFGWRYLNCFNTAGIIAVRDRIVTRRSCVCRQDAARSRCGRQASRLRRGGLPAQTVALLRGTDAAASLCLI